METRGLMVIKQTKKTRARQRKQAISNWKVGWLPEKPVHSYNYRNHLQLIGRKVIKTVLHYGVDEALYKLHSHERSASLTDDIGLGMRGERVTTSRGWLKSRGGSGRGRPPLPPHVVGAVGSGGLESESAAHGEKTVSFDLQEDILKRMDISGPPSVTSEPDTSTRPKRARKVPAPPPPSDATRAVSFSGLPNVVQQGALRKRSHDIPSNVDVVEMEIPNMPGTPTDTPPRVRADTFRRKDSPVKASSSRNNSGQT